VAANLALYRKYRSATFAEVIGQEHVTAPLTAALTAGRINHAYLFSGPRGCGKTSSARILARSLNCAQGPTPNPCGACNSCLELAPNGPGSIDVIEIDAASHGGVDDARELRERAHFSPARDRYKVYIIDEAHMVTTQGFNALLKLVEEPPDFLVFVFATTEPDKVLPTIRSRTHHYPFRLVPPATLRAHLERICATEGVTVEPAVLPLVVRAGAGSVRDSLSLLDQLIAGAEQSGVSYARAVALLGVTDAALLDDMVDALAATDAAAVYGTVDRIVEAGHDPRRFAADLLDRFRDLLVLEAVPDAAERGLVDASADQLSRMVDQAARLGSAALARFAEIVHAALIEMRGTTSPRLVLELLCARMLLPDASADAAALLQRVERLERRVVATTAPVSVEPAPAATARAVTAPAATVTAATVPPAEVPPAERSQPGSRERAATARRSRSAAAPAASTEAASAEPATARVEPATAHVESRPARVEPAPARVEPAASGGLDSAALRRLWPDLLDAVKRSSQRVRALLEHAQVSTVSGNRLTIAVSSAPLMAMISEGRNTAVLSAALTQVVGGSWEVAVELDGRQATTQAPAAEPDPRDDTEPDARDGTTAADPETTALRLLQANLGARPLDEAG
jgi:DNA polymerase III subunit gamma/tau